MNLLVLLPARRVVPVALVLLTAVGLALSLLTALMLVGFGRPGGAVLVLMWLVGSVGLVTQGAIGLLLLRASRRRGSRGRGAGR